MIRPHWLQSGKTRVRRALLERLGAAVMVVAFAGYVAALFYFAV